MPSITFTILLLYFWIGLSNGDFISHIYALIRDKETIQEIALVSLVTQTYSSHASEMI